MASTQRNRGRPGTNPGGGRAANATPARGKGKAPSGSRNAMSEPSQDELRLKGAAGRDPNDAKMLARKGAKKPSR